MRLALEQGASWCGLQCEEQGLQVECSLGFQETVVTGSEHLWSLWPDRATLMEARRDEQRVLRGVLLCERHAALLLG